MAIAPETSAGWEHLSASIGVDLSAVDSRTGYLAVELVNEDSRPVYFDSVTIRRPQSQLSISQEQHYYPFGLAMRGLAVNTWPAASISKEQFNGGSALEEETTIGDGAEYATFFRRYDPALGRFQGVDPLADKYAGLSVYNFSFNDPINFNDPTGAGPPPLTEAAMRMVMSLYNNTPEEGSTYWTSSLGGTVNNAAMTSDLFNIGAYNNLPGAMQYNAGNPFANGMANFGSFNDGRVAVAAHSVATPLAITVKAKAHSNLEDFIEWSKSPRGKAILLTSVDLLGGVGEVIGGVAGEIGSGGVGSALTIPIIVDGGMRVGLAVVKLNELLSRSSPVDKAANMPGNTGALVGALVDASGATKNSQLVGSVLNNTLSTIITGGAFAGTVSTMTSNASTTVKVASGVSLGSTAAGWYEDASTTNYP